MTLSKSTYDKLNADPKRSTVAKQGAYKRMTNEKRIASLQSQLLQMEVHRNDLLAALEYLIDGIENSVGWAAIDRSPEDFYAAIAKARGES